MIINIAVSNLTHETKKYALLLAIIIKYSNSEIANILKVVMDFIFKVRQKMSVSVGDDVSSIIKRNKKKFCLANTRILSVPGI